MCIQKVAENKKDIQVQAYCSSPPMLETIKVSVKIYLYEMYLIVQAILFLSRDEDILFVFYGAKCTVVGMPQTGL